MQRSTGGRRKGVDLLTRLDAYPKWKSTEQARPIRKAAVVGTVILSCALLVGLVSAFLPWLTENIDAGPCDGCGLFTDSISGFGANWGSVLYFFVVLDAAVFFVLRLPWNAILMGGPSTGGAKLSVADWLIYLVAGAAALGLTAIFLSEVPPRTACYAPNCSTGVPPYHDIFTASPAFGWVVAVGAAAAICAAALLKRGEYQPPPSGRTGSRLVVSILIVDAVVLGMIVLSHVPTIM